MQLAPTTHVLNDVERVDVFVMLGVSEVLLVLLALLTDVLLGLEDNDNVADAVAVAVGVDAGVVVTEAGLVGVTVCDTVLVAVLLALGVGDTAVHTEAPGPLVVPAGHAAAVADVEPSKQ